MVFGVIGSFRGSTGEFFFKGSRRGFERVVVISLRFLAFYIFFVFRVEGLFFLELERGVKGFRFFRRDY